MLFDRLETARQSWNVLEHSFYRRWSAGELSAEELGFYSGQYRHAVEALADATAAAARAAEPAVRAELEEHAAAETAHIGLWDDFVAAVDGDTGAEPLAETRACVDAWTAAGDLLEGLITLYAIESAQPAISRTKLEGLDAHYGVAADAPGARYFALHAELDHEHAAHSRSLIEELAEAMDEDRLVERAEAALRGNWELLDGVEEHGAG